MHLSILSRCRVLAFVAFGLLASLSAASAQATKQEVKKKNESATDPVAREEQGWWMKRHEQHLERVKPGKTDLIFIGDSITQGWEGGGGEIWERYYGPRHAVNLGIGGDRTQHVLWRLEHDEIKGINPKVAVVMIGTNNIHANSPDEIVDGVTAIVKTLRDKLPKTKILLLGIFPRSPKPDAARERIKAVNDKIQHLADGNHVTYLDISKSFLNADGTISPKIMPDYLHLSPKGYRLWADAIEPTLWSMMDAK
jgi:lysophospholipase L1-like esterase